MKYRQLTKEQFESLHKEFAQFLATQKIDANKWTALKSENSPIVKEELELFSDLVWDDVLNKVEYLEHFSKTSVNLFKCEKEAVFRIVVTINKEIDLLSEQGYKWLLENPKDAAVDYLKGSKIYSNEKNIEIFELIEKGSQIARGELYEYFNRLTS
ncbi:MAG: DUF6495 family protein [Flavobacteriaceae bacterium]|nr:DUF6495 family protein [Flavobacteriaceae bacterium]MDG2274672.1 DUF6495 family protein [Flavobacteriaceae bacterium]